MMVEQSTKRCPQNFKLRTKSEGITKEKKDAVSGGMMVRILLREGLAAREKKKGKTGK